MKLTILSVHPRMVKAFFSEGLLAKAVARGLLEVQFVDIRKFADAPHFRVDDKPYGGGAGMVLKVDVLDRALRSVVGENRTSGTHICVLSAKGRRFTQSVARRWGKLKHLVLICGRYEGIDERVRQLWANSEMRIGDYVLMGGEAAAAVVAEAVARLVPGVLGNPASLADESFSKPGRREYPQYTRPAEFRGQTVPKPLLNGNHREISQFRKRQK